MAQPCLWRMTVPWLLHWVKMPAFAHSGAVLVPAFDYCDDHINLVLLVFFNDFGAFPKRRSALFANGWCVDDLLIETLFLNERSSWTALLAARVASNLLSQSLGAPLQLLGD